MTTERTPPQTDLAGKELSEKWYGQANKYIERLKSRGQGFESSLKQFEDMKAAIAKGQSLGAVSTGFTPTSALAEFGAIVSPLGESKHLRTYRDILVMTEPELEKDLYLATVYGQLPTYINALIKSGEEVTTERLLVEFAPPRMFTPDELSSLYGDVDELVNYIIGPTELPEMATEAEKLKYPALQPPLQVVEGPPTISRLTVQAIVRSLSAPKIPDSVMTRDEWADHLVESGQISDKADLESYEFYKAQAEQMVADWQENINAMEASRFALGREMPEQTLSDLFKEMVIMPGLFFSDIANVYFEKVSQPLAGLVYGGWVPDIDAAYQRYKAAGESTWQALGHSWAEWDAPGEGAAEWILKYMLMESIVDPTTYLGWGIATKLTKPLGSFGRVIAATEKGMTSTLDLPFDLIKSGLKRIPKTTGQEASIAMAKAGQYVDKYMSQRFGKAVWMMTTQEWQEGINATVKYTLANSLIDNTATRAGKELLKHTPVTEKEVLQWAERLGTTLTPDQITKHTLDDVDRVFEDYFAKVGGKAKLLTNQEAADELIRILYGKQTKEMSTIAAKILGQRSRQIINGAYSFGTAPTTFSAMRRLMRRNYRFFIEAENSSVAAAMKEMGAVSSLLTRVPIRIQKAWANGIDKWIVRPFAESYLTFAMYGPMNIVEDVIRTTLGGEIPGLRSSKGFAQKWAGTSYDPALGFADEAISETMGMIRKRTPGESNNWILQLAAFGSKTWSERAFHYLTQVPVQISLGMRRNFVDARATRILKEIGGDLVTNLANVGPDKLMGISGKKLVKEIQQAATELKMQGLPDAIRGLKGEYTRARIIRREVDNIFKEHPNLDRSTRDLIMRAQDDSLLFTNVTPPRRPTPAEPIPDSAKYKIGECYRNSWKWTVDNHSGFIVQGHVVSPTEGKIRHSWVEVGDDVVDPTTGIRVDRERWYQLTGAEPDIAFTPEQYSVHMAKTGNHGPWSSDQIGYDFISVDNIERLRAVERPPTIADSIDGSIRQADAVMLDNFVKSPQRGYEGFEKLTQELTELEVKSPEEMAQLMSALNLMSSVYGATPKQILGRAVERTRGLPRPERYASLDRVMDDITIFRERAGASMDKLLQKIKVDMMSGIYDQNPTYITKSENLFNLQTAKRLRASELGEEINAWRHDFFATAPDLRSGEFWDDYSAEVIARHHTMNLEMADYDGQIKNAIDDLDLAGGIPARQRPPIQVLDRPLSLHDVGQLIGARGDDISRALLDVLTSQNDRDMFTKYVMAHVKPTDVGFTEEAIGQVYDQLWQNLGIDSQQASWISAQRRELEAVRRDLHSLYNSKLLPDNEMAAIGKYLDDTADAVEKELYVAPVQPSVFKWSQEWQERQVSDEITKFTQHQEGKKFLYHGGPKIEGKVIESGYVTSDLTNAIEYAIREGRTGEPGEAFVYIIDASKARTGPSHVAGLAEDFELLGPTDYLHRFDVAKKYPIPKAPKPKAVKPELKPEYANLNDLRQQAIDEAHKWYYKEFTDYTNANAFDAIMKSIYPFWTYESQRWFWLPRSFVRHPGTFTSYERWQDNSDNGYIHIPGTSVDINPFRGTVYGTLTTRLAKRDYPEYYDELGALGGVVEYSDFLSRYGFYPGAHIGVPLALFGGVEMQFGESLPAVFKTPLDALVATFPDNDTVKWISDRVFGDRFRNYMTSVVATRMGGDGTLIFAKKQENQPLTPEEEQLWTSARREVGWYSACFEQTGLFRLRTDEQHEMYQKASEVIEEMTGYTPDQQDWLRKHNYRLWDMIGGMSPSQQAMLQEMDYYKWVGNARPLLPGGQQEILNKIEIGWDKVEKYTQHVLSNKLSLQQDFLSGKMGSRDFNSALLESYDSQRQYILNQMEQHLTSPMPEGLSGPEREEWIETHSMMSLEGRTLYYKEYGIPQPVLHPMRELANLYFSIKLKETIDPETGEKEWDWDNFWAQRMAIEQAVPEHLQGEWNDFLSKNSTRIEEIRRDVQINYFRTYNKVYEKVLSLYSPEEQSLINEYLHLERTQSGLDRQSEIKSMVSARTGNALISSFRSDVSDAKKALRYANPHLDAWLYYWGRTSSFTSPTGESVYQQLARETGRRI